MNQTNISNPTLLGLRIAVSGIFISAGINHLQKPNGIEGRILEAPSGKFVSSIADPYFLAISSGVLLLLFGITFLFGIYTRLSAIALFILLIPITLTIQVYGGLLFGPFWKNVAIFGGLSIFIFNKNLPYQIFPKNKS